MIGRLENVPLRELWKHEERGFSAWLENNLDVLASTLGFGLADPQREVRAGNFQVDLVAEDENSNRVIIENQLEATDHDHLGKLLTYLTNLDAKIAIWITKNPRPEHIRAIQWLNETTPDDIAFYLIRLAAYRIGNSAPAPLFTVIVAPSHESKDFGRQKKELAERHVIRLKFWEGLLERAKAKNVMWHASRSPTKVHWLQAGAGRSGLSFVYSIWMSENSAVELYIDNGDRNENKKIFDEIFSHQAEIEMAFGDKLNWERLDEKNACRIQYVLRQGGLDEDEEKWPTLQDAMIDAMDRLVKTLKPFIPKS